MHLLNVKCESEIKTIDETILNRLLRRRKNPMNLCGKKMCAISEDAGRFPRKRTGHRVKLFAFKPQRFYCTKEGYS